MNWSPAIIGRCFAMSLSFAAAVVAGATHATTANGAAAGETYLGEMHVYAEPIDSHRMIIGLYSRQGDPSASIFTYVVSGRLTPSLRLRNVIAKTYFIPHQLLRIVPEEPDSRPMLFSVAGTRGGHDGTDIRFEDGVHLCRYPDNAIHEMEFDALITDMRCTADSNCSTKSGGVLSFSC